MSAAARAEIRATVAWMAIAGLVRALVAWRTVVIARDADSYLWMADGVAAGDFGAAFRTVFHPLYSLLTGPVIALGVPTVTAGQVVSCGLGVLAIWPLRRLAWTLTRSTAATHWACAFYALGLWFARHPADCLSEGPFFLLVAVAAERLVSDRSGRSMAIAGLATGLAYAARPEGVAIWLIGMPWLLLQGQRRAALVFSGAAAVAAAPWPLLWWRFGPGFTVTPKARFTWNEGVGGVEDSGQHYVENLVGLIGTAFEAIGWLAFPLVLVGAWTRRPLLRRDGAVLLLAIFALQLLVAPMLRSNVRFLSGFGILLLPLAGLGAVDVLSRLRRRPAVLALSLLFVVGDLIRLPAERRAERAVLIDLGHWLGDRLQPGELVATEMPRLIFYAGLEPLPPRPIDGGEILEWAERPNNRFVAIVERRTPVDSAALERLGYRPVDVGSASLRAAVERRGILIWRRD